MEAGRELDALIAEKVMGWKRGNRYGNGNGEWIRERNEKCLLTWDATPRFSTSIESAWQVVERMAADEYWPIYVKCIYQEHAPWFIVEVMLPNGFEVSAEADTAPLAICLAALKAVGGEVR